MKQKPDSVAADPGWKLLFRIGGIAPFFTLACYLAQLAAILAGGNFPADAAGWADLFQRNRVLGLLYLNALDSLSIAVLGLLFLALCAALWDSNRSLSAAGGFFALLGIPVFIIPRVLMLSLLPLIAQSGAADGSQQVVIETAMGFMQSIGMATPLTAGFFFLAVAGTVLSLAMLRTAAFGKVTAWVGIVAGLVTLAGGICAVLGFGAAALLAGIHGALWLVWWLLAGRKLWLLGR
jgi:hypothetical protein